MAHQQDGAGKLHQQRLQQLQCLHIQIVGGFVHHQQVGGFAEQARQQQSVTLTTRERLDRHTTTARWKEKVTEVADYVPVGAVDGDTFPAFGNVINHALFQVQLVT